MQDLKLLDKDGEDSERFAYWFARQFWNAIPLASNGYRPLPLPPPESGEPCPCGSGRLFRACCEPWMPLEDLPENVMWPALVQSRPYEYWIAASREGRLPPEGIVHAGDLFYEEGCWEAVADLIEPWFAPGRGIDEALADAIPLLCEAYDALNDSPQQKEELLRRLIRDPGAPIRCVANQRLAAWLHDKGDHDEACRAIGVRQVGNRQRIVTRLDVAGRPLVRQRRVGRRDTVVGGRHKRAWPGTLAMIMCHGREEHEKNTGGTPCPSPKADKPLEPSAPQAAYPR